MKILLTNDDGVHAEGILALASALQDEHEVVVVAPDRERSAASHSLTLDRPLSVRQVYRQDLDRAQLFSVNGTPVDCVRVGVSMLADGCELLLSGINNGANLGGDISYSGTVHAALEGTVCGVPSMALSLRVAPPAQRHDGVDGFATAARFTATIIRQMPDWDFGNITYNINFPSDVNNSPHAIKVCQQGISAYDSVFQKQDDPFGREFYWIYAVETDGSYNRDHQTDVYWSDQGYTTVTPLRWNMTATDALESTAQTFKKMTTR